MILIAGHYCHDTLIGNAGQHQALGGTAAYASAILAALGVEHEVVAKVGADFRYAAQVAGPPLVVSGRTTAFVDDYRGGVRRQRVVAVAPAIEPHDVRGRYDVGIAAAIAGELPPRTLAHLRQLCRIVVADAQALLRAISPDGAVELRPPDAATLEFVDVLKASREEAALLEVAALRRRLTLVITDGARGSNVLEAGSEVQVPAVPATEIDPTGAGDCFLAGLAVGLSRGLDVARAARIGAYCGARCVEHVGVPRLTREQAIAALEAAGR